MAVAPRNSTRAVRDLFADWRGRDGEVYRARDTRLDRKVAIKILPAEFAADAQLGLRLEHEAKTISALNHPNICTLYDAPAGKLDTVDLRPGR
jgi:serine/threonine protein kinase